MSTPTNDNVQERQQWMNQLSRERAEARMRPVVPAGESNAKIVAATAAAAGTTRLAVARKQAQATKQAMGMVKQDLKKRQEEGDDTKTGMWMLVFAFSILADLFTLIPYAGTAFAVMFGVLIAFIYAINGYFRVQWGKKATALVTTELIELIPIIDMLPAYTLSAVINYYWLAVKKR